MSSTFDAHIRVYNFHSLHRTPHHMILLCLYVKLVNLFRNKATLNDSDCLVFTTKNREPCNKNYSHRFNSALECSDGTRVFNFSFLRGFF